MKVFFATNFIAQLFLMIKLQQSPFFFMQSRFSGPEKSWIIVLIRGTLERAYCWVLETEQLKLEPLEPFVVRDEALFP